MSPKSLFNIVLKIFGLFLLGDFLNVISQFISTIPFFSMNDAEIGSSGFLASLVGLSLIAIYIIIAYLLLFKTNYLVEKLKLDKGFSQQQFSFDLSREQILLIALIVLGGIILVNEIPGVCRTIFNYFEEKRTFHVVKPVSSYLIIPVIKILFALLLIGERKRIVGFIERKSTNDPNPRED